MSILSEYIKEKDAETFPDISFWQGNPYSDPNFGVDFVELSKRTKLVILRVSHGTHYDIRFEEAYMLSREFKLDVEAYMYIYPFLDPEDQAEVALDALEGKYVDCLWIDVEHFPEGLSQSQYAKLITDVIEYIQEHRPDLEIGIYTRGSFWNRYIGDAGIPLMEKYPVWIARYHEGVTHPWEGSKYEHILKPKGAGDYFYWQFTEKADGKAWGMQSHGLDMNLLNPALEIIDDPDDNDTDDQINAFPFLARITAYRLNARNQPSIYGGVQHVFSLGDQVLVYDKVYDGIQYDWYLVRDWKTDKLYWCAAQWIEKN